MKRRSCEHCKHPWASNTEDFREFFKVNQKCIRTFPSQLLGSFQDIHTPPTSITFYFLQVLFKVILAHEGRWHS